MQKFEDKEKATKRYYVQKLGLQIKFTEVNLSHCIAKKPKIFIEVSRKKQKFNFCNGLYLNKNRNIALWNTLGFQHDASMRGFTKFLELIIISRDVMNRFFHEPKENETSKQNHEPSRTS